MQGIVWHGRSMILPVLLGGHAIRRRLIAQQKLSLFWPLSLIFVLMLTIGPEGIKPRVTALVVV